MKKDFQIAVLHGHGNAWKKVREYITECGFTPLELTETYQGDTILARLANMIWYEAHCAIVILTKDDPVPDMPSLSQARQNVVFELGYCFGAFDSLDESDEYTAADAVIVVEEDGLQRFANIDGLTTIRFKKGKLAAKKKAIITALNVTVRRTHPDDGDAGLPMRV